MTLHLYYQDADLLVVEKPAGMLSVPGRALENHDSVTARLQAQFGEIHVVHRLDMETSGILLFARNNQALSTLSRQFQQRSVQKTYLALCHGALPHSKGTIDRPLRCDWENRPRQIIDTQQGKSACTHWETLFTTPQYSLVKLFPVTGRTHQLRVHLQWLGHPILGDSLYHPAPENAPRLMLHATTLGCFHPSFGHWMTFSSPLPEEFGTYCALNSVSATKESQP